MYYEKDGDRLDIFPQGMPRGHHSQFPHDHTVVQGENVTYMRVDDHVIVDDRGFGPQDRS
jgi:hypothetical protein